MNMRLASVVAALVVASAFTIGMAPGSAHAARQAPVPTRAHYKPASIEPCTHGMSSTAGAHFVVWACNEVHAAAEERKALSIAESFYGPETEFMGRPLDNYGSTGDGKPTVRTDIYLIYRGQKLTREDTSDELDPDTADCADIGGTQAVTTADRATYQGTGGSKSSAYIAISRNVLERCPAEFGSTLAHEYFHVLSMRYNNAESCDGFWFTEASAVWAEWYFDPAVAPEAVFSEFKGFQDSPGRTLTQTPPGSQDAYADFVWPMFMQQQKHAASIVDAWKAMQGKLGCTALTGAVNGILPFAPAFDDFAVENFDTELQNMVTLKKGWPDGFGDKYQDLKPREGDAPEFPQVQPKTGTVPVDILPSAYPGHATVKVSLAPLSAQYDEVDVFDPAESAEFDFSGLSNRGDLGITLIAADHGLNGSFVVTKRIEGSGAKICFAADSAVDGTGSTGAGGTVYVILDDHSRDAKVTGSYTVTSRTACAASVSGTVKVDATTVDGNDTTVQTATMDMTLTPDGIGLWHIASSSTYSATYKLIVANYCNGPLTVTGQGSGMLQNSPDPYVDLQAYEVPYATPPLIGVPMLMGASTPGTYSSPCGNGTQTVDLEMSPSCPPPSGTGQSIQYGLVGRYTGSEAALDFGCSDTYTSGGSTMTNTVTGTLTATDPIPCGLWTKDCSIAVVAAGADPAAAQPQAKATQAAAAKVP